MGFEYTFYRHIYFITNCNTMDYNSGLYMFYMSDYVGNRVGTSLFVGVGAVLADGVFAQPEQIGFFFDAETEE